MGGFFLGVGLKGQCQGKTLHGPELGRIFIFVHCVMKSKSARNNCKSSLITAIIYCSGGSLFVPDVKADLTLLSYMKEMGEY